MPSYTDGQARPAGGGYGEPALAVREAVAADLSGGVDGHYTPLQVDATGALRVTGGGGGGGGASTIADGADVCEGTTTDALVAAGAVGTLSAKLRRMTQGLEDLKSLLVLAAGENHLGEAGGRKTNAPATVTRPANTTAYAINQVVGGATAGASLFTFTNLLRKTTAPGTGGYVVKCRLRTNQSSCVASFRLWLFYASNPTALVADQTAFAQLDADKTLTAGYIDVPALTTEGTGSDSAGQVLTPGSPSPGNLPLEVLQPNADRNLYGILVTKAVFTPASGQTFWVSLAVEND